MLRSINKMIFCFTYRYEKHHNTTRKIMQFCQLVLYNYTSYNENLFDFFTIFCSLNIAHALTCYYGGKLCL